MLLLAAAFFAGHVAAVVICIRSGARGYERAAAAAARPVKLTQEDIVQGGAWASMPDGFVVQITTALAAPPAATKEPGDRFPQQTREQKESPPV